MDKDQVLARLCALLSKVAVVKFGNAVAHDCICGENPMSSHPMWNPVIDGQLVEFVEEAVLEALTKSVPVNPRR